MKMNELIELGRSCSQRIVKEEEMEGNFYYRSYTYTYECGCSLDIINNIHTNICFCKECWQEACEEEVAFYKKWAEIEQAAQTINKIGVKAYLKKG
jgi:hypothetical protein